MTGRMRLIFPLLVALPSMAIAQTAPRDDYPPPAISEGRTGTTKVKVRINTDGKVDTCSIKGSSGHNDLDEMACDIALRRFQFRPALIGGTPVASTKVMRIRWEIKAAAPVVPTPPLLSQPPAPLPAGLPPRP